jgi:hypothetical protein
MTSKGTQTIYLIIGSIFSLVALGLDFGFYYFYSSAKELIDNGVHTKGVVIELATSRSKNSTTYAPVVEFTDRSGEKITFTSNVYSKPASYDVGENVEVLYPKNNPTDAEINSFGQLWFPTLLFGFLGGVFTLIGFGLLYYAYKSHQEREKLKQYGIKIKAKIEGIEQNTKIIINGKHPFVIRASYYDEKTRTTYQFLSDEFMKNPSEQIIGIESIEVWVDSNDFSKYIVDTSFIRK